MQYEDALRGWGLAILREAFPDGRLQIIEESVMVGYDRHEEGYRYYLGPGDRCDCCVRLSVTARSTGGRYLEVIRDLDLGSELLPQLLTFAGGSLEA